MSTLVSRTRTSSGAIHIVSGLSIRATELKVEFSRSGGPGGQHVNKVSSRVNLLFNIAKSSSLNAAQRSLLLARLGSRLSAGGVLRVTEQRSRSQWENRRRAVERLQSILQDALQEPKKRLRTGISQSARARRLEDKQNQAQKKRERRIRLDER